MTFEEALEESRMKDCRSIARRSSGTKGTCVNVWEVTSSTDLYFQTDGMSLKDLAARDWYVVREDGF